MTHLLLTWTDVWMFLGRAFNYMFKFLPGMGFFLNFVIWIIVAFSFFYWLYKQAKDTKQAQSEGKLI